MIGTVRIFRDEIAQVRPCYHGVFSTAENWLIDAINVIKTAHDLPYELDQFQITVDPKSYDVTIEWRANAPASMFDDVPGNGATFSLCGWYRYSLERTWEPTAPRLCWFMLNPSTADAFADDPTIRRCLDFARRWGFGSIEVVNMYPLRSPDPAALWNPRNNPEGNGVMQYRAWRLAMSRSQRTIAAWGAHNVMGRERTAVDMFRDMDCLGFTKEGCPRHPLYVPAGVIPVAYAREGLVRVP